MVGDEKDLASDAACLGVAQSRGDVSERELACYLRGDGTLGEELEDAAEVARDLCPVVTWAETPSGPEVEEVSVSSVGQRVPSVQSRATSAASLSSSPRVPSPRK